MPIDKSALFDFLTILNEELEKNITIVTVGGTAMTLLDIKSSTIDIDFTIPSTDKHEFDKAMLGIQPDLKIDVYMDGWIFSQGLPSDYLEKSIKIKEFDKILLLALNPIDIVVTKIGRLDERDLQDIERCIKINNLSKTEIMNRGNITEYAGNRDNYDHNLKFVIMHFFNDYENS